MQRKCCPESALPLCGRANTVHTYYSHNFNSVRIANAFRVSVDHSYSLPTHPPYLASAFLFARTIVTNVPAVPHSQLVRGRSRQSIDRIGPRTAGVAASVDVTKREDVGDVDSLPARSNRRISVRRRVDGIAPNCVIVVDFLTDTAEHDDTVQRMSISANTCSPARRVTHRQLRRSVSVCTLACAESRALRHGDNINWFNLVLVSCLQNKMVS